MLALLIFLNSHVWSCMCLCTWTYAAAWGWKHPTQWNHMSHRNRHPASHAMPLGSLESSGRYAQSRNAASARIPCETPCSGSACRWQRLTSQDNMEMTGVFENKIFCKNRCRPHRNESQLYVVFHKVQYLDLGYSDYFDSLKSSTLYYWEQFGFHHQRPEQRKLVLPLSLPVHFGDVSIGDDNAMPVSPQASG